MSSQVKFLAVVYINIFRRLNKQMTTYCIIFWC